MLGFEQWNQPLPAVNRCPYNYHFPSAQQLTSIQKDWGFGFTHSSIQSRSKCSISTISDFLFPVQSKLKDAEATLSCFYIHQIFKIWFVLQLHVGLGLILSLLSCGHFPVLIQSNFTSSTSLFISLFCHICWLVPHFWLSIF